MYGFDTLRENLQEYCFVFETVLYDLFLVTSIRFRSCLPSGGGMWPLHVAFPGSPCVFARTHPSHIQKPKNRPALVICCLKLQ